MSITTAAVLTSASKAGRTVSLVLDAWAGATSTFVYDSSAAISNGYVARIDPDGTYTPLNGGVGTPLGPNPAFSGNATISGTLGITPSSGSQTALTISAPAAGSVDAVDIYVGATKKIWVDNTGQLNATSASIANLTITTALTLPAPLSIAQGGTGTNSPAFSNGSNVSITGSFPNYTVAVVPSPSFSSLSISGLVTFPTAGTASSGTHDFGSSGGASWGYSLWDSTNGTVSHNWQLTVPNGAAGNLGFIMDGVNRFTVPSNGGAIFKSVLGTSIGTVANDGSSTWSGGAAFSGAVSATALTLSITPLAVTSGGTGTATPSLVGTSGVLTVTGSFPNQTLNLAHGDYIDIVNAQTIAGIKTFSSPPVMSGASITTGTIPDGAHATAYVLSVTASGNLASSGGRNPAITLSATPSFTRVTTNTALVSNINAGTTAIQVTGPAGNFYIDYAGTGSNYLDGVNTYFRSYAGTAYGLINSSGFSAGSSVYGPTSATINGALSVLSSISLSTPVPYIFLGDTTTSQTTPNKYIRAAGGQLQVLNSAYSAVILSVTDTGLLSTNGLSINGFTAISGNGDLTLRRSNDTGYMAWGTNGNHGMYWNSATMIFTLDGAVSATMPVSFGPAVSSSTVQATQFVATSGGILLSYSGAAAGTGFYHDTVNAAIRSAGSLYLQGASGSGSLNIAQVGSITASSVVQAPTFTDGGTAYSTYFGSARKMVFGTKGVNGTVLTYGGAAGNGTGGMSLGTSSATLAGITGNAFTVAGDGNGIGTVINHDGAQMAVLGNLTLSGGSFITASSTYGPTQCNINGYLYSAGIVSTNDITTHRGNTTGVIFLGNGGNRYVYYDSTNYQMPGGRLQSITGIDITGSGTITTGSSTYGPTSATVNGLLVAGALTATNYANASGANTVYGNDGAGSAVMRTSAGWHLQGASGAEWMTVLASAGNTGYASVNINGLYSNAALNSSSNAMLTLNSATSVQLQFGAITGGTYSTWIQAKVDGQNTAYPLALQPAGGSVGIGTYSPGYTLDVSGTIRSSLGVGSTGFISGTISTQSDRAFVFGNAVTSYGWTYFGAYSGTLVAGISGSVFKVTIGNSGFTSVTDLMTLDNSGNMGIAGTYYAVSHSSHKIGIRPIEFDPLDVIRRTTVRHFNYKHDPEDHEERLGLIADESPVEMMGPTQDRHDFMRTIAVLVAANQALLAKHEALEARVKDLEARCAG